MTKTVTVKYLYTDPDGFAQRLDQYQVPVTELVLPRPGDQVSLAKLDTTQLNLVTVVGIQHDINTEADEGWPVAQGRHVVDHTIIVHCGKRKQP